jgi:glycosyltransferase involved in cell wall biosynthesis
MSSQPKVSINVPSYNHARFLPATIESALAQTYKNIEILIADDGSTDGSLSIAQDFERRYPNRVRVLTHPGHANRGISATTNLCWENATGTYWMGLASDDLLHPRKAAEQVAFLERHPELDWVYGYAVYVDEDNRRLPGPGFFGVDITRAPDPVEKLIFGNVICGMTVLMRRSAVMELDPHDETLVYGDWDFWIRLASRHKFAFLPRVRARARVHGHNTSVGIPIETNFRHSVEVVSKLRRESMRLGGLLARPRTQALLDLQCAFYSYGMHDEERARRHLAGAFMIDPTLRQDARYFRRWLSHSQRILGAMASPSAATDFTGWVRAQLPADADQRLIRAVAGLSRGWSFWRGKAYDRVANHWQYRAPVLTSLIRDPRVWRERELFAFHIDVLLNSRLWRGLLSFMRRRAPRS